MDHACPLDDTAASTQSDRNGLSTLYPYTIANFLLRSPADCGKKRRQYERVFVDRDAALAEMTRRVDVRASVIRHREIHHTVALDVPRLGERLLVGLPDAVDHGQLARTARRAVI